MSENAGGAVSGTAGGGGKSARVWARTAGTGDVDLILELIRELADYELDPAAARATPDDIVRALFRSREDPAREAAFPATLAGCLIGHVGEKAEGFALFFQNFSTWTGRPGMYLEDLFVRPSARGAGLGKLLMGEVARLAVAQGCGRMEWSVLDWNTPAIGFYESLGAKAMSEWTVHRLTGEGLVQLARSATEASPPSR